MRIWYGSQSDTRVLYFPPPAFSSDSFSKLTCRQTENALMLDRCYKMCSYVKSVDCDPINGPQTEDSKCEVVFSFLNCVQKSYKRLHKMVQTHKPAASRECECECVCERGKVSEPSNLFSCTSDFYFTLLLLFFAFLLKHITQLSQGLEASRGICSS